jgi:hypothetical protein
VHDLEVDVITGADECSDLTINHLFLLTPQFSFFEEWVYAQVSYLVLE